jgi:hypothetical protein
MIVLMANPTSFARPADDLEACNHPSELTARALAAVEHADTLATLLALSADDFRKLSRDKQPTARDLAHSDLIATRTALGEAERLLAAADPLGCVDTSPAHETLSLARSRYHEALAAFGLDPLTLTAPAKAVA